MRIVLLARIVEPSVTPDERRRAGGAVAERIRELGFTVPGFAREVGLSPSTVRRVVSGSRWPRDETRRKLAEGLGWDVREFGRRAEAPDLPAARRLSTVALVAELYRRASAGTL